MPWHSSIDAIQTPSQGLPGILTETQQALLSNMRAARAEYDQAVSDFLDAVRRFSNLELSDREKEELLRQAKQREQAAFSKYKQTVEATQ